MTPERRQDGCVVTAAYVAAGSAMKRAMTGRRMIVGRGIGMCGGRNKWPVPTSEVRFVLRYALSARE